MPHPLLELAPVPTLIIRLGNELSADFPPGVAVRVSRAPGRLDVMGGIADYTGSGVCEMPLDRAAAVAVSPRADRDVQVFSFNLLDDHKPFTFRTSLDALAAASVQKLRAGFDGPGIRWAAYLAGCVFALHEHRLVDLADPAHRGFNLALYSTVPSGAGVSSSAAIEVATLVNLLDHFGVRDKTDGLKAASMCQWVENRVVGAPCGIMDQVASCLGEAGSLLRMTCRPAELTAPLHLPAGAKVIGINSHVKHSVGGGQYGKTRCAAFMGHAAILHQMRDNAAKSGHTLVADPMGGYLANLGPADYTSLFRPHVPETITGRDFLDKYGQTIDTATTVDPAAVYHVRSATDHHVLEAERVAKFERTLSAVDGQPPATRQRLLERAGSLMYASHFSYTHDARLGAPECDVLVQLVRDHAAAGLHGAKITGGGSGGTVAVLMDDTPAADAAIAALMAEYQVKTGISPEGFTGTSPGAWAVGTAVLG